ncbi:uncharacterized protein LOC127871011 [Dreissena polymorpha]|uniref:Uncharacterized protein n=1 Tax=Dreissena polymorpha TaxID=45954 RepID=A0A9D4LBE9_DREPO|nr:uncharacterized protein LOC127871011 [Dreissena polymorpha]KAH3855383.1 hypothetical protein DPMN_097950 [Dreissena polymorpha]
MRRYSKGIETSFNNEDENSISKFEENATILRPCLLHTIPVGSILTELTFLECSPKLSAIADRDPRAAMAMILNELQETRKVSFWIGFCVALQKSGYGNVAKLLTGPLPTNGAYQIFYMKTLSPFLRTLIQPQQLLDYLYGVGILDSRAVLRIKDRKHFGRLALTDHLLECLPNSHAFWYDHFVQALVNTGVHEEAVAMLNIPQILNDGDDETSVEKVFARNKIIHNEIPFNKHRGKTFEKEDKLESEANNSKNEKHRDARSLTYNEEKHDDEDGDLSHIIGQALSDISDDDDGSNATFSSLDSVSEETQRKEIDSEFGCSDSGLDSISVTYNKELYDDLYVDISNQQYCAQSKAMILNNMLYPWVELDDSLVSRGDGDIILLAEVGTDHFNDDCTPNVLPLQTLNSEFIRSLNNNSHTISAECSSITNGKHLEDPTGVQMHEYSKLDATAHCQSVPPFALQRSQADKVQMGESLKIEGSSEQVPTRPPALQRSPRKIQYTDVVIFEHKETMTETTLLSPDHLSLPKDCQILDVLKGRGTFDDYLKKIQLQNSELHNETPTRKEIVNALAERNALLNSKRKDIAVIRMKELEACALQTAMISDEVCLEYETDLTKGLYSARELKNDVITQPIPKPSDNEQYETVDDETSVETTLTRATGCPAVNRNVVVGDVSKAMEDDTIYKDSAIYSEYVPPSEEIGGI